MGIDTVSWCCLGLEAQWSNAGLRGVAVLVHVTPRGASFLLQHRAVDRGADGAVVGDPDVPISLVTDVASRFCPWCGRDLVSWYRDVLDELTTPGLAIGLPD